VTKGTWVRADGVVLERTFAQAAGVTVGGTVTLDGRPFRVVGLAVTAAVSEYPGVCYYMTCNSPAGQAEESGMGLAWLTVSGARSLGTPAAPLSYVLDLRLRDPAAALAFAAAHGPVAVTGPESPAGPALLAWQQVQYADNDLVSVAQQVLAPGSWTAGLVVAVALGVTLAATLVTAVRAARASTVAALADSARPPRRPALLLAVSAWLPAPLLIRLRLIARRQRRAVFGAVSAAITVMGVVAVMAAHRESDIAAARFNWFAGLPDPVFGRVSQVMAVLTVVLVALAAVNVIIAGWATAVDARQPLALSRALGGTRGQVSAGLAVAQVLPALPGALLGMPLGVLLFAAANGTGQVLVPPAAWLTALLFGTLAAVAALTFIPSLMTARAAVAPVLQAEAS